MQARISRINVNAFRGIPQLELDTERRSLLIKGDNGTGKSSIIEALEFFFTGTVSHLVGTQGVSVAKHGPHAHYTSEDVRIEVSFDPGNIILSRTMTKGPSPNKSLERYFHAAATGTFALRRSQILKFINGEPADRYSAIANIIGIEALDFVELEMQRLRDDTKSETKARLENINDLLASLSQSLGVSISSFDEVLPALNRKAGEYGFPNLPTLDELEKYNQYLYKKIKKKAQGLDQAKNLEELLLLIQPPLIIQERLGRLKEFGAKVIALVNSKARSTMKLLELLSVGKDIISDDRSVLCPLCGQPIETDPLLSTLESRIGTLTLLSNEASALRQDYGLVDKDVRETNEKLDLILSRIKSLDEFTGLADRLKQESQYLTTFLERLARSKDLIEPLPTEEFNARYGGLTPLLEKAREQAEHDLEEIGLTEDEKRLLEFTGILGVVNEKKNAYRSLKLERETKEQQYEKAQKIYEAFSSAKKTQIHQIYGAIKDDIQVFFNKLHPGEATRAIQLDIVPTRRASTQLLVDTLGMNQQDPRGLESEGHLDSLGVCIFLAFVKKFNADIPLMLLDDVVTTLDSGHRQRLAELLIKEFSEKQLVVTTIDNIWYEQLRAAERAYKRENDFKHIEIVGWGLETGPRVHDYKPTWESIDEKLSAGDKFAAGNQGRSYLEWILKNLCERMEIEVRYKMPPSYQVGELLPPAKSKILKLIDDEAFEKKANDGFLELEKTGIMANLLSHDNPRAEELAISEVRIFCEAVRNLHLTFSCPACGSFLHYFRALGLIKCSNEECAGSLRIKVRK